MSELPDSQPDGEQLADLLATLDRDSFIPVAALHTIAEILTYLHGKDADSAEAENAS